uniref:NAD(P)(+)--arginine ADP-ribosyltransferase n=1 Tax=Cryptomonas curvata TaxID=233186 RepID=A0A7S0QWG2_9CRYP
MYIASVASTAGVNRENVKVLGIEEVSARSSRIITGRLLLATSVHVQTSVLIPVGQQTNIKDQSLLNTNLNKNGLPSGTLVVQYTYTSATNLTTPAPGSGGSEPEAVPAAASNVPIGAIVGGAVGFSTFIFITLLALRYRRSNKPEVETVGHKIRPIRHEADIFEVPLYKPLSLMEDFKPTKTCRQYVEQDCTDALPAFLPHSRNLVRYGCEMASSIIDQDKSCGLDHQQVLALVFYTLDVSQYAIGANEKENFYHCINKALQKREPLLLNQLKGYLFFLLEALNNLPKEPEEVFYRGVGPDAIQVVEANYALGTKVVWSGITSTSRYESKAVEFAKGGGVVFRIRTVSGVRIDSFSPFPGEAEVLLAPNFSATVSRSFYTDPAHPGCRFIDLTEYARKEPHVF